MIVGESRPPWTPTKRAGSLSRPRQRAGSRGREVRARGGRDNPLPPALCLAHLKQPPFEVDVVPVESEQLAAAQTRVGEERKQEPIAFAFAAMLPLPDVIPIGCSEQVGELAPVEHIRQRLALARCSQHVRRVSLEDLVLDQKAKEALQRGDCPRLA